MAVILAPDAYATSLDPDQDRPNIDQLLRPCLSEWLQAWRVSRAVNKAGAEGPGLIAPIADAS
jgi:putative SOS response-associated peptidase YedK